MNIRIWIGPTLLAILPLGCSDTSTNHPTEPAPTNAGAIQVEKTDRGNKIKKHTLPTGPNVDAVSSGP